MEWTRETRRKLALRIRELSLEIQTEEFARPGDFPEKVEKTIERIMERLDPLGFTRAKGWFHMEVGEYIKERNANLSLYRDSPTHLWFETAQARIVTIGKDDAEKLLVLDLP
jgi:hypothetical protein